MAISRASQQRVQNGRERYPIKNSKGITHQAIRPVFLEFLPTAPCLHPAWCPSHLQLLHLSHHLFMPWPYLQLCLMQSWLTHSKPQCQYNYCCFGTKLSHPHPDSLFLLPQPCLVHLKSTALLHCLCWISHHFHLESNLPLPGLRQCLMLMRRTCSWPHYCFYRLSLNLLQG